MDRRTLEALYVAHGPMVLRRARLLLRDEHAASDALHDVFVRVLRAEHEFRARASPATWLYRITTNDCLTLAESFGYASQHTIAATTQTAAGPQHPMYRYDLTGREDLVLTYTTAHQHGVGSLTLSEPGIYVIQRRDTGGPMVAEVTVQRRARVVAVAPGDYFITRRAPDHLLQGTFSVAGGATTPVEVGGMTRIAYAQLIRKGDTERETTTGVFAVVGARGAVGNVGAGGLRLEGGLRIDRRALSYELRALATLASVEYEGGARVSSQELGATIGAYRVFDHGTWSLAAGLALGPVWRAIAKQSMPGTTSGGDASVGVVVGVLGQLQRTLTHRTYARVELGALGYWFGADSTGEAGVSLRFSWSLGAGLGASF